MTDVKSSRCVRGAVNKPCQVTLHGALHRWPRHACFTKVGADYLLVINES